MHGISQRRLVILHPGQGKCQQWWRKFFIAFVGQVIPGNIQPVGVTASILIGEYIVVPDDGGPINFCASGAGQEKAAEDKQLNNTHGLASLMPEKILAYYRPYCSGYSTVLIRTRIVLVVEINHSISWPTDNPSSARPIGESTEILSARPSVSLGYPSVYVKASPVESTVKVTREFILPMLGVNLSEATTSARCSTPIS